MEPGPAPQDRCRAPGEQTLTLPRRMGLEMKLNQMVSRGAMVADLVTAARAGMEKLATKDEYIKPPYRFMSITAAGVKEA